MAEYKPLKFPAHFPPKARWKRFFIGVRWLGPDLSFFRNLGLLQASRTESCMTLWSAQEKRDIAQILGKIFQRQLFWKKSFFIPEDEFRVIANGPKFRSINYGELEAAIEEIEAKYQIRMRHDFWTDMENCNFNDVVNKIISLRKTPKNSLIN